MNIRRLLCLLVKELIAIWRDPKSRMTLLLPPLIQLLIFTFAATLEVKNVQMGVLNLDEGKQGWELIERFEGSKTFKKIHRLESQKQIGPFMDQQKGLMVLYIDSTFSRNVESQKESKVLLILDGRRSNSSQVVMGYASEIISHFSQDVMSEPYIRAGTTELVSRNWFNPNLLYYWFNIPSLVSTLSMLTCLIITSIAIARERELGTFDQLLVSPMLPFEILLGKALAGIIVGVLEGLMMVAAGILLFQVPFTGSFILFLISLFVFIFSICGMGLFVSSLSSTQQQAMLGTFTFTVPSILLSGFATPVENMPEWLQWVSYGIPLRYMLVIAKGIFLKALPLGAVLDNLWPMALIGCFTFPAAALYFRRKIQ